MIRAALTALTELVGKTPARPRCGEGSAAGNAATSTLPVGGIAAFTRSVGFTPGAVARHVRAMNPKRGVSPMTFSITQWISTDHTPPPNPSRRRPVPCQVVVQLGERGRRRPSSCRNVRGKGLDE